MRLLFSSLLVCVIALATIALVPPQKNSQAFIGNDKCLSCHEKQREYSGTAHHSTSQAANANSIAGSFALGKNILRAQRELQYRMEAKADGFYQTGVLGPLPDTI